MRTTESWLSSLYSWT